MSEAVEQAQQALVTAQGERELATAALAAARESGADDMTLVRCRDREWLATEHVQRAEQDLVAARAAAGAAARATARAEFDRLSSEIEERRSQAIPTLIERGLAIAEAQEQWVRDAFAFLEQEAEQAELANDEAEAAGILDRVDAVTDDVFRTAFGLELRAWHGRPEVDSAFSYDYPELQRALARIGGGYLHDVELRKELLDEAFASTAGADVFAWFRPAPDPDADSASAFALRVPYAQALLDRYCPEEEEDDANAAD